MDDIDDMRCICCLPPDRCICGLQVPDLDPQREIALQRRAVPAKVKAAVQPKPKAAPDAAKRGSTGDRGSGGNRGRGRGRALASAAGAHKATRTTRVSAAEVDESMHTAAAPSDAPPVEEPSPTASDAAVSGQAVADDTEAPEGVAEEAPAAVDATAAEEAPAASVAVPKPKAAPKPKMRLVDQLEAQLVRAEAVSNRLPPPAVLSRRRVPSHQPTGLTPRALRPP